MLPKGRRSDYGRRVSKLGCVVWGEWYQRIGVLVVYAVHVARDLPPSLQQGVGFGIYINIGRGWAKIKAFPLHC